MQVETTELLEKTQHEERHAPERRRSRRRRRRPVRIVVWSIVAVVAVLGALAAWVAVDALTVRTSLTAASELVPDLQQQIADGDEEAAQATLVELQGHASDAREASHGPHWSFLSSFPVARENLQAVQVVTDVVGTLATDALPSFADVAGLVGPGGVTQADGLADLAALAESAPRIIAADASVQAGLADLRAVETDELLTPVAAAVADLTSTMADIASTTSTAARAAQMAPSLSGADEPTGPLAVPTAP